MKNLLRVAKVLLIAGLALGWGHVGATDETRSDDTRSEEEGGRWEMRVCAPPDAYPISSRERPGYENRIAEILADNMGARLTFEWTRIDSTGLRNTLQAGECDLVFGVLDGANGVLTTIPYHRAPYAFVYRADAGIDIESLQDEAIADLRIAVEPNSFPQLILSELGHSERLVVVAPSGVTAAGANRIEKLLGALERGEADLTIVYGPDAAALGEDDRYVVRVVQPEILPPFHQLFRTLTIGVRLNDDAFRDRLGIALAETWQEVQAVLTEYGVPQLSVVQPTPPRLERTAIPVGAVLPMTTGGWRGEFDVEGMAARVGALAAEDFAVGEAAGAGQLSVFIANAPTPEAADRAARRLIATEDVVALLGGIGDDQARVLAGVAEEELVPFLNIEDDDPSLRSRCLAYTFHVAPDESMYLAGIHELLTGLGVDEFFVVREDSELGDRLHDRFDAILEQAGGRIVGEAVVAANPAAHGELLEEIADSGAEGVVLLQGPGGQEFFLSQYRLDIPVTGYPHPTMQTREFLGRLQQVVNESGRFRVAGWDPRLVEDGADRFNELVVGRSGEPADLTSWTAFAAAKIVQQAAGAVTSGDSEDVLSHLESTEASFRLLKEDPLAFGPDHQLAQPLYQVELDLDAPYNRLVGARLALAEVTGVLGPFSGSGGCDTGAEGAPR